LEKEVKESRRVILVTGTPGVGKTVFSRLLASRLGAVHMDLGRLVERENLVSGRDGARGTLVVDEGRASRRLGEIIAGSGRDVVVDGHYAVDVVPAEKVSLVFVLRRDPDELKSILEDRGFGEVKVSENLAAEILDVCLWEAVRACGAGSVCEIDASGREPGELVEEAISVLEGRAGCRVGVVDWLGKLDSEGRLDEFFKALGSSN